MSLSGFRKRQDHSLAPRIRQASRLSGKCVIHHAEMRGPWHGIARPFDTGAVAQIVQRALADAKPVEAEIEPVAAGSLAPVLSVCSRPLRFAS